MSLRRGIETQRYQPGVNMDVVSDDSAGRDGVRKPLSSSELDERLDAAAPTEQRSILQSLYDSASETGHQDDWTLFAQASLRVGDAETALDVLEQLAEQGDRARIRLASAHFHSDNFSLCRFYLSQVAEHGAIAAVRAFAEQKLQEATEAWFGSKDGMKLRSLQVAALKELVASDAAGTDDVQRLAQMLLDIAALEPELGSLPEVVDLLESALSRFGDDVCLLEMLAECRTRFDPEGKLEAVLETLRPIAPESDVFEAGGSRQRPLNQAQEALDTRFDRLRSMLDADAPALCAAVLGDMHRVVAATPSSFRHRFFYAAALNAVGEPERALAQTDLLARFQSDRHDHHYVVADLYLQLGHPERARSHVEAALRFAEDAGDISDAMELKEQLDASL